MPRSNLVHASAVAVVVLMNLSTGAFAQFDPASLERIEVQLVPPPFVHPHDQIASGPPRVVAFRLVIEEKQMVVDSLGTTVQAMTFNGSVPGPLMVVHEGDYVELTLVNPETNTLPHNIDFHAATGALGGGELTQVFPGQEAVIRWKATRSGVFVYHCAPGGEMIPWHVVSGMNGAIMVLPREGLADGNGNLLAYDKVFYIGEQDFYIPRDENGTFRSYGSPLEGFADMIEVMKTHLPTHVVFNGSVGALAGENALTADVGDTVLIVHSQANRDSRPHLIGGHADYVWEHGKFANAPDRDYETWFIRGGSAGAALYTFRLPGLYAYVNHNLIDAVLLGAAAHFRIGGEWDDDLMTQISGPGTAAGGH
jgi:nitrite reductase (NO-forming)